MPLTLGSLPPDPYFARFPRLITELRELIAESVRRDELTFFRTEMARFQTTFESAYGRNQDDVDRFGQMRTLLTSAQVIDRRRYAIVFGKINAQQLLTESPFPTVELLNKWEDEIENYFLRETKYETVGQIPVVRLSIPQIRYLRRCLAYLLMCEGWFEEAAKFLCRLASIVGHSLPTKPITEEYVSFVRAAGYPKLVEGYDLTIRNAIAHGDVKMDRREFTFTNKRTRLVVTASLSQFMRTYYQPMAKGLELWMMFVYLRTLEVTAERQLH